MFNALVNENISKYYAVYGSSRTQHGQLDGLLCLIFSSLLVVIITDQCLLKFRDQYCTISLPMVGNKFVGDMLM